MATTIVRRLGREAIAVDVATVVLRVLSGPDQGRAETFELTPIVIGTGADADLVLTDPAVSRRHLRLVEDPGGLRLEDLDSTNGTFVAGARVQDALLEEDAEVRVGETRLRIELREETRFSFADDVGGRAVSEAGAAVAAPSVADPFKDAARPAAAPSEDAARPGAAPSEDAARPGAAPSEDTGRPAAAPAKDAAPPAEDADPPGAPRIVGRAPSVRALRAALRAAGPSRASVLLLGESGTGKDLAARYLHAASGRRGPLVVFDASTADPAMLRSDLFGHEAGAFTGATGARKGAVREANGGTLFLDEVGELPLELQAHLLRTLETRAVTPMGADRPTPVDLRVVAATHRDLPAMVEAGTFRLDLYHRLAVIVLGVPPLRDRLEDLDGLVAVLCGQLGVAPQWSASARDALRAHPWPGNVRELRNVLERAGIMAQGREVRVEDLGLQGPALGAVRSAPSADAVPPASPTPLPRVELGEAAESAERRAIQEALEATGGVRRRAAERLGISVATLWRRMKRYKLG